MLEFSSVVLPTTSPYRIVSIVMLVNGYQFTMRMKSIADKAVWKQKGFKSFSECPQ